ALQSEPATVSATGTVAPICRDERRLDCLPIKSGGRTAPLQDYAPFPSLPIASTGQPSIASLQRPSSSGVSGCLYTKECPPSSFRLKLAGGVFPPKPHA